MIGVAVRILKGGIHSGENTEVVKALLDFALFHEGQRVSLLQSDILVHQTLPRRGQA